MKNYRKPVIPDHISNIDKQFIDNELDWDVENTIFKNMNSIFHLSLPCLSVSKTTAFYKNDF